MTACNRRLCFSFKTSRQRAAHSHAHGVEGAVQGAGASGGCAPNPSPKASKDSKKQPMSAGRGKAQGVLLAQNPKYYRKTVN